MCECVSLQLTETSLIGLTLVFLICLWPAQQEEQHINEMRDEGTDDQRECVLAQDELQTPAVCFGHQVALLFSFSLRFLPIVIQISLSQE